uniref:Uncharacterized protein n=1 Tax=Oxyrrhis marina TaxID=2969 RepID=A0A7S3ULW3_OXYMA
MRGRKQWIADVPDSASEFRCLQRGSDQRCDLSSPSTPREQHVSLPPGPIARLILRIAHLLPSAAVQVHGHIVQLQTEHAGRQLSHRAMLPDSGLTGADPPSYT